MHREYESKFASFWTLKNWRAGSQADPYIYMAKNKLAHRSGGGRDAVEHLHFAMNAEGLGQCDRPQAT